MPRKVNHNNIIGDKDAIVDFLNGRLKEEVYIDNPSGFLLDDDVTRVFKLNKTL